MSDPKIYFPAAIMTRLQQVALSQAIDIPLATSFTVTDGIGTVRRAMTMTPNSLIWDEIYCYVVGGTTQAGITYVAMDPGTLVVLKSYLDEWLGLGSATEEIIGGGVDGITQVHSKPSEQRRLLSQWIHGLVPFFTKYEYLKKQAGEQASIQGQAGTGGQKAGGVFVNVVR